MMQNFLFRSAVQQAALRKTLLRLREPEKQPERLLIFFDDGKRIKNVLR